MKFDTVNITDCIVPPSTGASGGSGGQTVDPRCSDADFAKANPMFCASQSFLIIKPSVMLLCALDSVNFAVFEYVNGIEKQVTDNLTFECSENSILAIGVHTGSATGLMEGTVIVTVSRNGLTASADITVLAADTCCDSIAVKTSILLDNSRSSGLAFGSGYNSRLDFAKTVALSFSSTILGSGGLPKDSIKIWSFAEFTTQLSSGFITDTTELADEINNIELTLGKTDLLGIITDATDDLFLAIADEKVVILISDGEQTANTKTQAILDAASTFKRAGGIIIVVGLRASGTGYDLLSRIATGGFFINATPSNTDGIIKELSYLKSILCAGECKTDSQTINQPGLDYSSFANWEVISGQVNLLGPGFLDLLPGNGLYVDLNGGTPAVIRSIDKFDLVAGHSYRISFSIAGNNRLNTPDANQGVLISLGGSLPVPISQRLFHQAVYPTWDSPFNSFSFTFTPQYNASQMQIYFEQLHDSTFTGEWHGNLLDVVKFEDVTTLTTLLFDNFDGENPVTEGASSYGESCESPDIQLPDPNPLPDVESGTTSPTKYTSTKTYCATCPSDQRNVSDQNLIPEMTSDTEPSGIASSSGAFVTPGRTYGAWRAFADLGSQGLPYPTWVSDRPISQDGFVYLRYEFANPQIVYFYSIFEFSGTGFYYSIGGSSYVLSFPRTWAFRGSNDGITWVVLDSQIDLVFYNGETKKFAVPAPVSYKYYELKLTDDTPAASPGGDTQLPTITRLSMFGSAMTQICKTASATSYVSQADADAKALTDAQNQAEAALNCTQLFTSTQSYTASCPTGSLGSSVTKSATATSLVSQEEADASALAAAKALAEAALDCYDSNNGQPITINDNALASPCPSVKKVSGLTGLVTKVTVSIGKLSHEYPEDIVMVLRSPSGEMCMLMGHCGNGNSISDVDLVFDDAASNSLPQNSLFASGTFKPTGFGPFLDILSPDIVNPYGTTLSVFNGVNPNGSWSLWIMDDKFFDTGQIANGWDLTITTA